jgi:hypothetical protein
MAKKKAVPKKKSCTKKSCGKCPDKNCTEGKEPLPEFIVKPLTKTDYFFGMIKRAFGYE